ncbi:LrgB family protein [Bacillus spongiae]|uniref:LrgB family protein n=1 Tax=Bacillus spongiae TaxID=2683610 RepID=A0ABU8HFD4_9BACI
MNSVMMILLTFILTVSSYVMSIQLAKKYRYPITTPIFLSSILIIAIFLICDISYEEYEITNRFISYMLGPATVALAVPIYKNRTLFIRYFRPAIVGGIIGSLVTISSAVFFVQILDLGREVKRSIILKSITTPVAVEVADVIEANRTLAATFVIVTGMIGAMIGPWLLTKTKVNHPVARGLSLGVISHGIGTSEAIKEGELEGAVAGSAMGVTSFTLSFVLPLFFL